MCFKISMTLMTNWNPQHWCHQNYWQCVVLWKDLTVSLIQIYRLTTQQRTNTIFVNLHTPSNPGNVFEVFDFKYSIKFQRKLCMEQGYWCHIWSNLTFCIWMYRKSAKSMIRSDLKKGIGLYLNHISYGVIWFGLNESEREDKGQCCLCCKTNSSL